MSGRKTHEGTPWPYHEDPQGRMVPCGSNPCRLHGGGDIDATGLEEAYRIHDDIRSAAADAVRRSGPAAHARALARLRSMVEARGGRPLPVPAVRPDGTVVEGETLPVIGVIGGDDGSAPVFEVDGSFAASYSRMLTEVFRGGGFGGQVSEETPESMAGMRMFVVPDGQAGAALASDDATGEGEPPDYVTAVFKTGSCSWRHTGTMTVRAAVSQGGRRLDCFETFLPKLYAKAGFRVVARMAFDERYAPDTWDYQALREAGYDDHPDVVFMSVGPGAAERSFDDYDEAQRYAHDSAIGAAA